MYQTIVDLPQFSRPNPLPPDPGLINLLGNSKNLNVENGSSEQPSYIPFGGGASTSLMYSNWLASDQKNVGHLFGLQGTLKFFLNDKKNVLS